ncbi:MAG: hypothetical protein EOP34_09930 [Rickettsiales bacterium]|nr:MAG: hypothetical protein EOP34_09930 [Rickettsiales bacterium]
MTDRLLITKDHFSLHCYNDIKNIIQPLKELLGINYFCFRRIYDNGNHIALTANPEWLIKYYNNHYYLKKETTKSGIRGAYYPIIWDHLIDKDKFSSEAIRDAIDNNYAHSLSLKYIEHNYMDLYSFAVPLTDEQANYKYLQYYESIKKFIL